MNYLIIDDEPIAHRIIEGYCKELPQLKKVGNAFNAFEASDLVINQEVDLIFLDINMPKITGFEWLKTLSHPPKIIVTTAYQEHALEGYELNVIDYLLKPFSFPRFLKAVNKATETGKKPQTQQASKSSVQENSFFLKGDKTHHQIHLRDICFVEALGNYSKVFLQEQMIVTHKKISELEHLLPEQNFLRVHKSLLVAIDKIVSIQGNQIYLGDHKIPIGQTYRSRINQLLEGKM